MRRTTVLFLVCCLLVSPILVASGGALPVTNGRQVEPQPSLPLPARVSVGLQRWQNGWRVIPAPGLTVPAEPGNPPLAYTGVEPTGKRAMIMYPVPGGRVTPRAMEVELYLADFGTGSVRPVAAPGLVSYARWSPGGRWYSFGVGESVDADLWVYDAQRKRLMQINRRGAANHRWLGAGFLQYYFPGVGGLSVAGVDLARGRQMELAGPGEAFHGLLAGDQSALTRGPSRQVFLRSAQAERAPGTLPVSPPDAFVNTAAVSENGQRLVYAFTRSKGVPGGANTLYVDTLGVRTASGQAWEIGLDFRGDLRDGHLALSPDGSYLFIDYANGTDEPAQGLYLYDLDAKRLSWFRPKRGASPHLIGWEADGAVVMDCAMAPPVCRAWRITPKGKLEPWMPGVEHYRLAGEAWGWQTAEAWWFKRPGLPERRLLIRDLPPGSATEDPPYFDGSSGFARVSPSGDLLLTDVVAWRPPAQQSMIDTVAIAWSQVPANLLPRARLERLSAGLKGNYYRRLADSDHDGLPDLHIAYDGDWDSPYEVRLAPMMLFRGADLVAGRMRAHVLAESYLFPKAEHLADVTGDRHPEVVVKTTPTGSGAVSHWLVYTWTGSRYDLIFQHALDHWRGDNWIRFEPERITFTCHPWRTYEHKFDPHRVHEEVWLFRGGRFQFGSHQMPPPTTIRQGVIDAEAHFRRQDYSAALALYRKALQLPPEPPFPSAHGNDREWRPYVHLRLGQTLALLGRTGEADQELRAAVAAGGYVGGAAATFQRHLQEGVPEAMAALWKLPGEPHRPEIPPMSHLHGEHLAPRSVVLQAFLERNAERAMADLQAAIGEVPHLHADLDGDGRDEVWSMIGYNSFLGVKKPQGWRVSDLGEWTRTPELVPAPDGPGKLIKFGPDLSSHPLVGWNGREVVRVTISGVLTSPLLPPAIPGCKGGDGIE